MRNADAEMLKGKKSVSLDLVTVGGFGCECNTARRASRKLPFPAASLCQGAPVRYSFTLTGTFWQLEDESARGQRERDL